MQKEKPFQDQSKKNGWIPQILKQYEKFVLDWHNFLLDVQEVFYETEDETLVKNLNMYVLSRFYYTPYKEDEDFYPQFYVRLEEAKSF